MHASPCLPAVHRWLGQACPTIHATRRTALFAAVHALLDGGKLALTHLGRNLGGDAFPKHAIKRIDRLLGNPHLHAERLTIYRAMAHWLLGTLPQPILLVDWADGGLGGKAKGRRDRTRLCVLRAAVALRGRAVVLYEEVHPLADYNTPGVHQAFLVALHAVLPVGCCPILVTDAGFRGPWFRAVEALGWDWIGRVRNQVKVQRVAAGAADGTADRAGAWADSKTLYAQATTTPRGLGDAWLSKGEPYACTLYLVRERRRGGHAGQASDTDPWLLATSLPHTSGAAKRVVRLYARRMQIEQAFRDTKNPRWGFGLRYAQSDRPARVEILLLIGALGALACWLAGLGAATKGWTRHFQVNTRRTRPELSTVFVGRQLLRSPRLRLTEPEVHQAVRQMPALIAALAIAA